MFTKKPGDMLRNELMPAHADGAERRTVLAHDNIVDRRTNRDKSSREMSYEEDAQVRHFTTQRRP
jgi:hypothetical protein